MFYLILVFSILVAHSGWVLVNIEPATIFAPNICVDCAGSTHVFWAPYFQKSAYLHIQLPILLFPATCTCGCPFKKFGASPF